MQTYVDMYIYTCTCVLYLYLLYSASDAVGVCSIISSLLLANFKVCGVEGVSRWGLKSGYFCVNFKVWGGTEVYGCVGG